MLKVTFEKPRFLGGGKESNASNVSDPDRTPPSGVYGAGSITSIRPGVKPKRKEKPKLWTWRERAMVLGFLLLTVLIPAYLWYKGNGGKLPSIPELNFGDFGTSQTIELR